MKRFKQLKLSTEKLKQKGYWTDMGSIQCTVIERSLGLNLVGNYRVEIVLSNWQENGIEKNESILFCRLDFCILPFPIAEKS